MKASSNDYSRDDMQRFRLILEWLNASIDEVAEVEGDSTEEGLSGDLRNRLRQALMEEAAKVRSKPKWPGISEPAAALQARPPRPDVPPTRSSGVCPRKLWVLPTTIAADAGESTAIGPALKPWHPVKQVVLAYGDGLEPIGTFVLDVQPKWAGRLRVRLRPGGAAAGAQLTVSEKGSRQPLGESWVTLSGCGEDEDVKELLPTRLQVE